MSIASCAPEVGTGFVAGVVTAECSLSSDGRPRHYLKKIDGKFICVQCGALDPRSGHGSGS